MPKSKPARKSCATTRVSTSGTPVESLVLWKLYDEEGDLMDCFNFIIHLVPEAPVPEDILLAEVCKACEAEVIQPPETAEEIEDWLNDRVFVISTIPLADISRYPEPSPPDAPDLYDQIEMLCRQAAEDRNRQVSPDGLTAMVTDLQIALDATLDEHAEAS